MPLIGGGLGDMIFGRYKAILAGICIYFIGKRATLFMSNCLSFLRAGRNGHFLAPPEK
jgi:dipeptide/tripeptide permease